MERRVGCVGGWGAWRDVGVGMKEMRVEGLRTKVPLTTGGICNVEVRRGGSRERVMGEPVLALFCRCG